MGHRIRPKRCRLPAFVLLLVSTYACTGAQADLPKPPGERASTQHVRRGRLVERIFLTGTVEAINAVTITAPRVPGGQLQIRWMEEDGAFVRKGQKVLAFPPATRGVWEYKIAHMAPEGEEVAAGTPVLSFDASQLERRLVELQAAFESAREELEKKTVSRALRQRDDELRLAEAHGKLEKARLKLDRPEGLAAANETRTLELDRELAGREITYIEERRRFLDEADATELLVLREERDRSRARVQELEEVIERMSLEAPRGGTIVYVTNRSGEKKRVGDTVWRREKVLAIPDLSEMAAEGRVEESDSGRIAEGQRVELRLDAYPEVTFTGTVRKIGKTVLPRTRNSPNPRRPCACRARRDRRHQDAPRYAFSRAGRDRARAEHASDPSRRGPS